MSALAAQKEWVVLVAVALIPTFRTCFAIVAATKRKNYTIPVTVNFVRSVQDPTKRIILLSTGTMHTSLPPQKNRTTTTTMQTWHTRRRETKGAWKMADGDFGNMLHNLADEIMDAMARKVAKDITDEIIRQVKGMSADSSEFKKRESYVMTTVINNLQDYLDSMNGGVTVQE